jgi:hypothetical protein
VIWCWTGPADQADEALAEARSQPGLLMDGVQPMPLPALQSAFDPIFPPGDQWYWRADFVEEISDEAIEQHVEYAAKLHPVDEVVAGPMFWSLESAPELMRWYREFILDAPEELGGFFAFLSVPPAPPFPEELHLQKVAAVIWCWTGPAEQADEVLAEARSQPGLLMDGVQPMPLPALQSAFDPVFPTGEQWYWRADFVEEIPDEAIEKHVEFAAKLPSWKSTMHLYPIDGAAHRVGPDETPWGYRNANWGQVIVGVDPDPANAQTISEWAIAYHEALHPFSAGGAYVNMMMDEGQERVKASYGRNYDRLAKIKAEYDPGNIFHVNQNIRPAA